MLGRGTRLCSDINKTHFTIFDCLLAASSSISKMPQPSKSSRCKKRRYARAKLSTNIWNNVDKDYNVRVLVRRLQRIGKDMGGEARQKFAQYVEDGDIGKLPPVCRSVSNRTSRRL
jgi:type I restriction enzyme R subunit